MTPSVVASVYGAWRILLLDPDAYRWFDISVRGFWHSFKAAAILAPFYLGLILIEASATDIPKWYYVIIEMEGYVLNWLAFPVMMIFLCRLLGRTRHYIRYVVAANWATIILDMLHLPFEYLVAFDVLAPQTLAVVGLMMLAIILAYSWQVARTALEVSGMTAAGVVFLSLILSLLIGSGVDAPSLYAR